MSEEDSKLVAILKSFEVVEHAALRERARILQVLEQRVLSLQAAQERRNLIQNRLKYIRGRGRFSALHTGELSSVRSASLYGGRLEVELRGVEGEVETIAADVKRAQERVAVIDEELVQARQDRKRIEMLLGNREQVRRIVGAYVEEVQAEELHTFRRNEKR